MAFVQKCGSRANEGYVMGLVRSTSFGRKRVALSNLVMEFGNDEDCVAATPSKRRCSRESFFCGEKPALENLPQETRGSFFCGGKSALEDLPLEILIRILCGVEHDDLKRLFFVSKAVRDATLIAKQSHFAYSTPKKMLGFQNVEFLDDPIEFEAPNAPKQSRLPRNRLSVKKLTEISVALFASDDDEGWLRRDVSVDMQAGN